jgi:hypothetical protein
VGVAKAKLLQLAIQGVEAETIGDRRIDVQRFVGDAAALYQAASTSEGLHVVQAIGELDQDHAHVARHGQQHLAEILRLRFFEALVLDAIKFGNAVHQIGHNLAEASVDLLLGDRRVFHHVVQQGGNQPLASRCQLARFCATASGCEM